jgi:hypothetical protein
MFSPVPASFVSNRQEKNVSDDPAIARFRDSVRLARLVAAVSCLLGALLLSSFAAWAEGAPSDEWSRVEHPSKEQCDAAAELAKQSAFWGVVCGPQYALPGGPPTQEQQQ